MSIEEKTTSIRAIISLVCSVLPEIVQLVKELVIAIKDIRTAQKGVIMAGRQLNYRKSQSIFTKNAVKQKTINSNVNLMRGGVRL